MTIKQMKNRLREINAEAQKISAGAEDSSDKLNRLLAEAENLERQIAEAEAREKLGKMADRMKDTPEGDGSGEGADDKKDAAKERGKALMSGKAIKKQLAPKNSITSKETAMPKYTAPDLNQTFNEVSSLIDRVHSINLEGGESYTRAYVKQATGDADYTAEGTEYTDVEPKTGYVEITKTKITAYTEEPEEIAKLAVAGYDEVIEGSVEKSIRKKISKEILIGQGGAGKLCGIFYNPTSDSDDVIDRKTDISISEIDENTLDEIIYSFGGVEDVEDVACLILNKMDLKAFAKVRKANGEKAYKIENHGNTGLIDSVPYIINSACEAITSESTAADKYCMAYGPLSSYELAIFSEMELRKSDEYKFKTGQTAFRGNVFVGGSVTTHNGFIRVKKKSE